MCARFISSVTFSALTQFGASSRFTTPSSARSSWHGIIDTPKSGRSRQVELTQRLSAALKAIRHMRGDRVLYDGTEAATDTVLHRWMAAAQRRAGLKVIAGGLHILRHSFCSHLAMQGAPARAIQELAGHADLTTTMRYMHLSPSSRREAIGLLDRRPVQDGRSRGQIHPSRGDIAETGGGRQQNNPDFH